MKIKPARETDLPRIVDIYNHAVLDGSCTADTEPTTIDEKRRWFSEHREEAYPIFVVALDERVVAWCSISPHRPGRKALRFVAEISCYVDPALRRRGIGKMLVDHVIGEARRRGFRNLFALLLDVNAASIRLLKRCGFTQWGRLPRIAVFDDFICGQLIYGRAIVDDDGCAC